MAPLLVLLRVLLAVVFAVAGAAKLVDGKSSREALMGFGVPGWMAPVAGTVLPLAELLVAVLLLAGPTAWWGGVGALVLIATFIVGIAASLARGRKPLCRCFGQMTSRPIGRATLLRNVAFAACALPIVLAGNGNSGPGILTVFSGLQFLAVAAFALVLGETWVLVHLFQQNGRLLMRLDAVEAKIGMPSETPMPGLAVGSTAPPFEIQSLTGSTVRSRDVFGGNQQLILIFADPDCTPCKSLFPEIAGWQRHGLSRVRIALVSRGPESASRHIADTYGLIHSHFWLQKDDEVADAYAAFGTPAAVLIGPDGSIRSRMAMGHDAIRALVEDVARLADIPDAKRLLEPATVR